MRKEPIRPRLAQAFLGVLLCIITQVFGENTRSPNPLVPSQRHPNPITFANQVKERDERQSAQSTAPPTWPLGVEH
jgi:hypothetical protein